TPVTAAESSPLSRKSLRLAVPACCHNSSGSCSAHPSRGIETGYVVVASARICSSSTNATFKDVVPKSKTSTFWRSCVTVLPSGIGFHFGFSVSESKELVQSLLVTFFGVHERDNRSDHDADDEAYGTNEVIREGQDQGNGYVEAAHDQTGKRCCCVEPFPI